MLIMVVFTVGAILTIVEVRRPNFSEGNDEGSGHAKAQVDLMVICDGNGK